MNRCNPARRHNDVVTADKHDGWFVAALVAVTFAAAAIGLALPTPAAADTVKVDLSEGGLKVIRYVSDDSSPNGNDWVTVTSEVGGFPATSWIVITTLRSQILRDGS